MSVFIRASSISNLCSIFLQVNVLICYIYNHGNNIVGLFDALPNFPFTTSET